jgi:hypothetical protein
LSPVKVVWGNNKFKHQTEENFNGGNRALRF